MCAWEGLVDVAKPGDRVEVTGVYRAVPLRVNPRQRNVRAIYKTYVDIVHVRKLDKSKRLAADTTDATSGEQFFAEFEESNELEGAAAERVAAIHEMGRSPTLYDDLSHALAPSVWELDDVKRGVLLQLFGGTHKQLDADSTGGSKRRGEINVLLINHGQEVFSIRRGERIAQMVIAPVTRAELVPVDVLSATERGSGGFGSTGR